ncbi:MAG: response regulator [Holophagaceae bacterium]|nr:response regulator [Holophagaceae bacterium]
MSSPLRLLMAEDSPADAALVVRSLEEAGYAMQWRRVDTAEELRQSLDGQAWDVLVSDYRMPDLDAPGALAILRGSGLDLPFIVISGSIGIGPITCGMDKAANVLQRHSDLNDILHLTAMTVVEAQQR